MAEIIKALKFKHPLDPSIVYYETDDGKPLYYEAEAQKLEFVYQFMYDNDPACEYVFDKEMQENPKQDINDLMASIIDRNILKYDRTRDCLLGATHRWMKITSRHKRVGQAINKVVNGDKPKLWLITFTTKDSRDEMFNYFKKHIIDKGFKCAYVEEVESADSKRPHIHAIVEGNYFHTKKNLRPTRKYDGNINIKQIITDNGTFKYISKENNPKGDVDYIKTKLSEL